jgi:hypothetical protein
LQDEEDAKSFDSYWSDNSNLSEEEGVGLTENKTIEELNSELNSEKDQETKEEKFKKPHKSYQKKSMCYLKQMKTHCLSWL